MKRKYRPINPIEMLRLARKVIEASCTIGVAIVEFSRERHHVPLRILSAIVEICPGMPQHIIALPAGG